MDPEGTQMLKVGGRSDFEITRDRQRALARRPGLRAAVELQLRLLGWDYMPWPDHPDCGAYIAWDERGRYPAYWHQAYRRLFGEDYHG